MKRKNVGGKKSGNVLNQPHHLTPAKGLLPLVTKEMKLPCDDGDYDCDDEGDVSYVAMTVGHRRVRDKTVKLEINVDEFRKKVFASS